MWNFNIHNSWWYGQSTEEAYNLIHSSKSRTTPVVNWLSPSLFYWLIAPALLPIFPEMGMLLQFLTLSLPRQLFSKADWLSFHQFFLKFSFTDQDWTLPTTTLEVATHYIDHMEEAILAYVPTFKWKKHSKKWWTPEIWKIKTKLAFLNKQTGQTSTLLEIIEKAKGASKEWKEVICQMKWAFWEETLSNTYQSTSWKKLQRATGRAAQKGIPMLECKDTIQGKCEVLSTTFFSKNVKTPTPLPVDILKNPLLFHTDCNRGTR